MYIVGACSMYIYTCIYKYIYIHIYVIYIHVYISIYFPQSLYNKK